MCWFDEKVAKEKIQCAGKQHKHWPSYMGVKRVNTKDKARSIAQQKKEHHLKFSLMAGNKWKIEMNKNSDDKI